VVDEFSEKARASTPDEGESLKTSKCSLNQRMKTLNEKKNV